MAGGKTLADWICVRGEAQPHAPTNMAVTPHPAIQPFKSLFSLFETTGVSCHDEALRRTATENLPVAEVARLRA